MLQTFAKLSHPSLLCVSIMAGICWGLLEICGIEAETKNKRTTWLLGCVSVSAVEWSTLGKKLHWPREDQKCGGGLVVLTNKQFHTQFKKKIKQSVLTCIFKYHLVISFVITVNLQYICMCYFANVKVQLYLGKVFAFKQTKQMQQAHSLQNASVICKDKTPLAVVQANQAQNLPALGLCQIQSECLYVSERGL